MLGPQVCVETSGEEGDSPSSARREIQAHPPICFLNCGLTSPGGTTALEVWPRGGEEEDRIPISILHTEAPRSYVNNPR